MTDLLKHPRAFWIQNEWKNSLSSAMSPCLLQRLDLKIEEAPSRTSIEGMAIEIGIISDIQVHKKTCKYIVNNNCSS